MRKLLFLILMSAFFMAVAVAGPASPYPVTVTQPDGTQFKAKIRGDEHQRWMEDLNGYTIIRNQENRFFEYAAVTKSGNLVPSGVVYRPGKTAPQGMPKGLMPQQDQDSLRLAREEHYGKAASQWNPTLIQGQRNLLFIAVNFTDRQLVTTAADWDQAIFDTTPGLKTVANFYDDNSRGLIQPVPAPNSQTTNPNGGIVVVNINQRHPNTGNANLTATRKYRIETGWINDALAAATAHVDFNALDTNNDGDLTLDEAVIYFIVAGYDASSSANEPNVWAHKWSAWSPGDVMAGNVQVNRWAINGELYDSGDQHPIGVITHELGHLMCYLPDLYDIQYDNQAMGIFSLMAAGSWGTANGDTLPGMTPVNMDAWSRYVVGWTNPRIPTAGQSLSFGLPLATSDAPVLLIDESKSSDEYFLVENRHPTGWDLGMEPTLETPFSSVTQGGNTIDSAPMTYAPEGNVTATAVACGRGQVGEFPASVSGKIALIERGDISFVDKVNNAMAAGATAAIIYNNTTEGPVQGTLGAPGNFIPAVGVSQADGPGLAGQTVTVNLTAPTWNGGLLVQHIDVSVGSSASNNINSSSNAHQGVVVEEASSAAGSMLTSGSTQYGHASHLFYSGNSNAFGPDTTPSSDYYNGQASGLGLYNISAPGTTMNAVNLGGGAGNPIAPVASFGYSASGLDVSFTNSSSDADGTITANSWDFGDGNGSSAANPSHTYAFDGSYTVSLTVTDNDGLTNTYSTTVTVADSGSNQAPTAAFSFNVSDLDVDFNDGSVDSDGNVVAWSWNFGDGNGSSAQNPSHSYAAAGTYTVSLTVTDNAGDSDVVTQQVTVNEPTTGGTTTVTQSGTLGSRATDAYNVTVSGGVIDLSVVFNNNSADLDLYLFDPSGNQVATATTTSNPETLTYNTNGVAGTYQVQVYNYARGRKADTDYDLTITYQP